MTPAIVFENLTAALRLAERMLKSCKTVDEFNAMLEKSVCSRGNNRNSWAPEEFSRAKAQLACGEGLGRGFIDHFLSNRKGTKAATVQTVIDSYYAESRKAAAERPFR